MGVRMKHGEAYMVQLGPHSSMTAPARYGDDANVPPPARSTLVAEAEET